MKTRFYREGKRGERESGKKGEREGKRERKEWGARGGERGERSNKCLNHLFLY